MKVHAFRLTPGKDLKKEIKDYAANNSIHSGVILTCVGGFSEATIRMAGGKIIKSWKEDLEIVSLVGTLSKNDSHLHISASKRDGSMIGGHLMNGCLINTTAEVIIAELSEYEFTTELDPLTGYKELKVNKLQ